MPASSRISRMTASLSDSPDSQWPPGTANVVSRFSGLWPRPTRSSCFAASRHTTAATPTVGRDPAAARDRLRQRYLTAAVAIFTVICALNLAWVAPLVTVIAASALMVFVPFVLKRHITANRVALVLYEGAPALMMLYVPLL